MVLSDVNETSFGQAVLFLQTHTTSSARLCRRLQNRGAREWWNPRIVAPEDECTWIEPVGMGFGTAALRDGGRGALVNRASGAERSTPILAPDRQFLPSSSCSDCRFSLTTPSARIESDGLSGNKAFSAWQLPAGTRANSGSPRLFALKGWRGQCLQFVARGGH